MDFRARGRARALRHMGVEVELGRKVIGCELRIVAAAADLLRVEARGTFLQRVAAKLRGRRDFSDCDVEQAVRGPCSISQRHDLL
jgi:hypothetical protein